MIQFLGLLTALIFLSTEIVYCAPAPKILTQVSKSEFRQNYVPNAVYPQLQQEQNRDQEYVYLDLPFSELRNGEESEEISHDAVSPRRESRTVNWGRRLILFSLAVVILGIGYFGFLIHRFNNSIWMKGKNFDFPAEEHMVDNLRLDVQNLQKYDLPNPNKIDFYASKLQFAQDTEYTPLFAKRANFDQDLRSKQPRMREPSWIYYNTNGYRELIRGLKNEDEYFFDVLSQLYREAGGFDYQYKNLSLFKKNRFVPVGFKRVIFEEPNGPATWPPRAPEVFLENADEIERQVVIHVYAEIIEQLYRMDILFAAEKSGSFDLNRILSRKDNNHFTLGFIEQYLKSKKLLEDQVGKSVLRRLKSNPELLKNISQSVLFDFLTDGLLRYESGRGKGEVRNLYGAYMYLQFLKFQNDPTEGIDPKFREAIRQWYQSPTLESIPINYFDQVAEPFSERVKDMLEQAVDPDALDAQSEIRVESESDEREPEENDDEEVEARPAARTVLSRRRILIAAAVIGVGYYGYNYYKFWRHPWNKGRKYSYFSAEHVVENLKLDIATAQRLKMPHLKQLSFWQSKLKFAENVNWGVLFSKTVNYKLDENSQQEKDRERVFIKLNLGRIQQESRELTSYDEYIQLRLATLIRESGGLHFADHNYEFIKRGDLHTRRYVDEILRAEAAKKAWPPSASHERTLLRHADELESDVAGALLVEVIESLYYFDALRSAEKVGKFNVKKARSTLKKNRNRILQLDSFEFVREEVNKRLGESVVDRPRRNPKLLRALVRSQVVALISPLLIHYMKGSREKFSGLANVYGAYAHLQFLKFQENPDKGIDPRFITDNENFQLSSQDSDVLFGAVDNVVEELAQEIEIKLQGVTDGIAPVAKKSEMRQKEKLTHQASKAAKQSLPVQMIVRAELFEGRSELRQEIFEVASLLKESKSGEVVILSRGSVGSLRAFRGVAKIRPVESFSESRLKKGLNSVVLTQPGVDAVPIKKVPRFLYSISGDVYIAKLLAQQGEAFSEIRQDENGAFFAPAESLLRAEIRRFRSELAVVMSA